MNGCAWRISCFVPILKSASCTASISATRQSCLCSSATRSRTRRISGIEMTKRVNLRGRALKIRLTTLDSVEEIQVEIRNSREKNADTMLYGFMFLNTNQRVEKAIDAYIFKVQQEQIRKSRR